MKRRTGLITALIIANLGLFALLIMGLKTVSKYSGHYGDWHHTAALAGSILIALLMLVSLFLLLKLPKKVYSDLHRNGSWCLRAGYSFMRRQASMK